MEVEEIDMSKLAEIDKNFKTKKFSKDGLVYSSVLENPFSLHGVFWEDGKFRRMPETIAKTVSDGVYALHTNTAGGRVRFKTDSKRIAIFAKLENCGTCINSSFLGNSGFDLYSDNVYSNTLMPPYPWDISEGYEAVHEFEQEKEREVMINFPPYSDVIEFLIGVDENASLSEPESYNIQCPVVYYGSSITQGGCASRPGKAYEAIISRRFGCDYINLGFSGNGKAEIEIAEYISKLNMSLFVYDYDHNAPTVEHLRNTHQRMFKIIRESQSQLPIIIMSRPKYILTEVEKERLNIIQTTYKNAIESGDKNVYFISGNTLMNYCGNEGTIDNVHPNDSGFDSIAKVLGDTIEKIHVFSN